MNIPEIKSIMFLVFVIFAGGIFVEKNKWISEGSMLTKVRSLRVIMEVTGQLALIVSVAFSMEFQIYTCTVDQPKAHCIKLEIKKYWLTPSHESPLVMKGILLGRGALTCSLKSRHPFHSFSFNYFNIGYCLPMIVTSFNLWPLFRD